MPDITSMFPRRFFGGKDLGHGERIILTVEAVRPMQANAKFGGGFGRPQQQTTQVQFGLFCRELAKPIELRKGRAAKLAVVFNSTNTDDWIGKTFEVYNGIADVGGEIYEDCLLINAEYKPQLEAGGRKGAIAGIRKTGRFVPKENMDRWIAQVRAQGKVFDDFLKWLKNENQDAIAIAFGVGLDELDVCLAPYLKKFLDVIHDPPAIAAQRSEPGEDLGEDRIDESSLETQRLDRPTPRATSIPGAGKRPTPSEIRHANENPDDIPF